MGMKSRYILFLLLVIAFCSCEKQRFLNVPFEDARYVVNGLFASNEPCHIELSKSKNLNDTADAFNISTATILLFENDIFVEELNYYAPAAGQKFGTYLSTFKSFTKLKKYSISIEVDGNTITSSDIIPSGSGVAANFLGPALSDTTKQDLNFSLNLKQATFEKQYFHLLLQQRWVEYQVNLNDTTFTYNPWLYKIVTPENDPTGFIPSPSQPFSLRAGGNLNGILLDNEQFSNQMKAIRFATENEQPNSNNSFLESRVIVRSVSASYFDFYYNTSQYHRTKSIPLTEPVIIHNNITGGIGNFSGFSSDTSLTVSTFY